MSTAVIDPADRVMVTTEQVAKLVAGISIIGHARKILERAGWTVTLVANRITVEGEVIAQLIPAKIGTYGPLADQWIISAINDTPPVWIVGSEVRS
jgi:hypothetical protein